MTDTMIPEMLNVPTVKQPEIKSTEEFKRMPPAPSQKLEQFFRGELAAQKGDRRPTNDGRGHERNGCAIGCRRTWVPSTTSGARLPMKVVGLLIAIPTLSGLAKQPNKMHS